MQMSLIMVCAENGRGRAVGKAGKGRAYRKKEEFASFRGLTRIIRGAGTIVLKTGIKRLKSPQNEPGREQLFIKQ
ncbi:hypothetical protein EGT74_13190 [Chitinophaga lutea]|uniref:Uncharacterized protein n=1 Tax=Chitinophaga lutea TaxID=2488634 RepID=A0A3N4PH47_9BACT|nr:hypothetical protein EGT74_13190 [Chitinophaga lutea]